MYAQVGFGRQQIVTSSQKKGVWRPGGGGRHTTIYSASLRGEVAQPIMVIWHPQRTTVCLRPTARRSQDRSHFRRQTWRRIQSRAHTNDRGKEGREVALYWRSAIPLLG